MVVRSSLTLFAVLLLASCDRGAPDAAQEQGVLKGDRAGFAGVLDEGRAGELMPAVTVTDPEGRQLNLGATQGGPVLVNLWATWCAPCIKEMPLLDELAAEYDGRLRVVAVSQDFQGAEAVAPFFAERGFSVLHPWLDPEGALMDGLEANVLPTTVLYNDAGQEIWRVVGDYDWSSAAAREAIEAALADT